MTQRLVDYRWPVTAFLTTIIFGWVARLAIGNLYSAAEAVDMLTALSQAGLYLASSIAAASATTLALILTLIGFVKRVDQEFDTSAYRNIAMVARLSVLSLLTAFLLLMAFVLPIGEFDELPDHWFEDVYNVLYAGTIAMVGFAVATVTLMYKTVIAVISRITPGADV